MVKTWQLPDGSELHYHEEPFTLKGQRAHWKIFKHGEFFPLESWEVFEHVEQAFGPALLGWQYTKLIEELEPYI